MEDPVAISRRSIVKTGFGAAALAAVPGAQALAQTESAPVSETLAMALYKSLSEYQRNFVCFPFDDPRRQQGAAQSHFPGLSADQREMLRQIFIGLHSPDYVERVMAQVEYENVRVGDTAIAFFGEPGSGKFEFVQAGQHLIRRCAVDSDEGAFGAPIWYGHDPGGKYVEQPGHPGNAYFYQARQASQMFKMLDGRQQTLALVDKDPGDHFIDTVKLSGKTTGLPGIPMTELSPDQKDEVRKTLATLLAPFRKADADKAMEMVDANGFDNLHIAFYKGGAQDSGEVWNVWQIEGPAMHSFFHGVPHVHAYAKIRRSADV